MNISANNLNCQWSATLDVDWISFTGPSAGTGSQSVNYKVQPLPSALTPTRTGTLTVGGQKLTITQKGTVFFTVNSTRNLKATEVLDGDPIRVDGFNWTITAYNKWQHIRHSPGRIRRPVVPAPCVQLPNTGHYI